MHATQHRMHATQPRMHATQRRMHATYPRMLATQCRMQALPHLLPNLTRIMIFLLFNRQIFPIILNWRIFWKLVVHISRSVVLSHQSQLFSRQSFSRQSFSHQLFSHQSFSRLTFGRRAINSYYTQETDSQELIRVIISVAVLINWKLFHDLL